MDCKTDKALQDLDSATWFCTWQLICIAYAGKTVKGSESGSVTDLHR